MAHDDLRCPGHHDGGESVAVTACLISHHDAAVHLLLTMACMTCVWKSGYHLQDLQVCWAGAAPLGSTAAAGTVAQRGHTHGARNMRMAHALHATGGPAGSAFSAAAAGLGARLLPHGRVRDWQRESLHPCA